MMRLRFRALALVAIFGLVALAGVPAGAQEVTQLEGTVVTKGPDGQEVPVPGAFVDVYRTDQKGKWNLKADSKGRFIFLGAPVRATVAIVVSAPGMQPVYRTGIRVSAMEPQKFVMNPGSGSRPTLEEITAGAAAPAQDKKEPEIDEEERARLEAERKAIEEKNAKILANKALFDEKKALFDAAIAKLQADDYAGTIDGLTATLQGLETADPEIFNEMIHKASSNLAEAHYQQAVSLFNSGDKEGAKRHLELAARNIERAIKIDPSQPIYYQIQGKTGLLLVDKYSMADKTEPTALAYLKMAEAETDAAAKREILFKAAEAYRAGYLAEMNGAYDEAKVNAYKSKAVETYKKLIAEDPNNVNAYYGVGLTMMASPTMDKSDYQMAADYLNVFAEKAKDAKYADKVADAQKTLATLAKDFKIKPRPIQ